MRALRFERFGGPEVLGVEEVADPVAGDGVAVVAVKAASINPSDVLAVSGRMEDTTLPRTPGRDFAGVVLEGPDDWVGAEVWGTGGDIGYSLDGSHAERIALPVSALARKPVTLDFAEAATVGVNFVVGWLGAVETAELAEGETIAVFGVSGGVGGAVAQIARAVGARRIVGVAPHAPAPGTPAAEAIDAFVPFDADTDVPAEIRRLTGGRGADVVYDAVGGVTTPSAVASLAHRGRLVVISAIGTSTAEVDLRDFYHRELRMLGVDSRKLDVTASAERLKRISPHFERGEFRPLPIVQTFDLDHGPDAYRAVAEKTVRGRAVIQP
ncbi:quinone oxidoreductase family protein [Peterkaempfera bronchialis]|uniref:Zinc-binding alcohol dehydrogenase family protein n=1 Tax=Peterkaempfera bronchialis TaxID=2126346 RepID=A0A345T1D8_9ACTN|nr:zinc-binding alcohol dehydrogenase family protein [Peterkaempfera bronchialis]AXI79793.1 zinc-binding alcohol dehydrogenase family protein [Peterkaempfera bronchialis]